MSLHSNILVIMSTQAPEEVKIAFDAFSAFMPKWLDKNIAFEIELRDNTELEKARSLLSQVMKVNSNLDIVLLSSQNRQKKLIISDMDSTLIHQECIDEIADMLGLKTKVAEITDIAMRGEMDFKEALFARVSLLEGLSKTKLNEVWEKQITLMEGAETFIKFMKEKGAKTILVSGGFTFFAQKVAQKLGFDHYHANELLIENQKLTGKVSEPILGQDAKLEFLKNYIDELNIKAEDCLAIGDGANDLKMIKYAGMGIAYQAKPAVQAQAQYRLNHTDLRGALYLQGYKLDH